MHRTHPHSKEFSNPNAKSTKVDNVALDIPFILIVTVPYLCDFLCIVPLLWWSASSRTAVELSDRI